MKLSKKSHQQQASQMPQNVSIILPQTKSTMIKLGSKKQQNFEKQVSNVRKRGLSLSKDKNNTQRTATSPRKYLMTQKLVKSKLIAWKTQKVINQRFECTKKDNLISRFELNFLTNSNKKQTQLKMLLINKKQDPIETSIKTPIHKQCQFKKNCGESQNPQSNNLITELSVQDKNLYFKKIRSQVQSVKTPQIKKKGSFSVQTAKINIWDALKTQSIVCQTSLYQNCQPLQVNINQVNNLNVEILQKQSIQISNINLNLSNLFNTVNSCINIVENNP